MPVTRTAESSSIKIDEEYDGLTSVVNINANEIKQVFTNIVNNALQAMPHGGSLSIRLKIIDANEVVVEFADTGKGISRENIKKIFDLFFLQKKAATGPGWASSSAIE